MVVLVTCKNEEDPIKNEGARVLRHFSHCKSMVIFSDAQGQLTHHSVVETWLNFKLIRDFMAVLLTCKNEKDLIKNEGTRVLSRLYIDFSDAQGQLTPQSVVESCQNPNLSKLLWLFLLPARMKKIQSKMKTTFLP